MSVVSQSKRAHCCHSVMMHVINSKIKIFVAQFTAFSLLATMNHLWVCTYFSLTLTYPAISGKTKCPGNVIVTDLRRNEKALIQTCDVHLFPYLKRY